MTARILDGKRIAQAVLGDLVAMAASGIVTDLGAAWRARECAGAAR
jgi:hypothetical protein